ncbi:MAG: hypothetical protein KC620_06860 [Myxococcales bacterium]|nr:hypothetical protein [Myxococcales bacterium]
MSPRFSFALTSILAAALAVLAPGAAQAGYTLFESGQVRPLALSPDGSVLAAVNTPDGRLEVFAVDGAGLHHRGSVFVGLEPVAVAMRDSREVWVVNHLSDSVSIVRLDGQVLRGRGFGPVGRVERTLLVGDEPRDVVFGGVNREWAFVTTAHRGQNAPFDPQLSTPGVGRADVWVFSANGDGGSLGGTPTNIITLFTDTPRALAVSPDGATVYAAGFQTGNKTTTIFERTVADRLAVEIPGLLDLAISLGVPPGVLLPGLVLRPGEPPQPSTSRIVQNIAGHWLSTDGRAWDPFVPFNLPDRDVFAIDATANPPAAVAGDDGAYSGVGTILYNMVVNPANGHVYVSNTDANNVTRFEGSGALGSTVRGNIHKSRITVLGGAPRVAPHALNKHIDYNDCCDAVPNAVGELSLAIPTDMAITPDGGTLYLAAFGSNAIGIFDTADLEADTFVPAADARIELSGGGPSGVVYDAANDRLYVMTRFNNSVAVVDAAARAEIASHELHSPESDDIVNGRRFLYDARHTSSNGETSCATCHVYGHTDKLAWDLGNPDGAPAPLYMPPLLPPEGTPIPPMFAMQLKGPMTTQSLRGLFGHGAMHWRGDRFPAALQRPDLQGRPPEEAVPADIFDGVANFEQFNGAFVSLHGRDEELPPEEMRAFADFIMQLTYPPNPIRNLDNSLTDLQAAGRARFYDDVHPGDARGACARCHDIDLDANADSALPGRFGTSGELTFTGGTQWFKVAQLRGLYEKVGKFGMADTWFVNVNNALLYGTAHLGDQISGFGVSHDGSVDIVPRFLSGKPFQFIPFVPPPVAGNVPNAVDIGLPTLDEKRALEAFVMVFPTNMAPIVGQQVTAAFENRASAHERVGLFEARADANECDLVAKTTGFGRENGLLYVGGGRYLHDAGFMMDGRVLFALTFFGARISYTCVPPGDGERMAVDRDEDGSFDGEEALWGTDPSDPTSFPRFFRSFRRH